MAARKTQPEKITAAETEVTDPTVEETVVEVTEVEPGVQVVDGTFPVHEHDVAHLASPEPGKTVYVQAPCGCYVEVNG